VVVCTLVVRRAEMYAQLIVQLTVIMNVDKLAQQYVKTNQNLYEKYCI